MKKPIFLVLLVLTLALLPVAGQAAITTYTDQATFLAALDPGYYTEDFSGLASGDLGHSVPFSGGVFSYTLSAASEFGTLWGFPGTSPSAIATTSDGDSILGSAFASTGSGIAGIGGFFYLTDASGAPNPDVTVNVTMNATFHAITYPDPVVGLLFFGIIDDTNPITSLSVAVAGISAGSATITNLTVGALPSPVPVPPAVLLMGSGLLGLIGFRKKFAR